MRKSFLVQSLLVRSGVELKGEDGSPFHIYTFKKLFRKNADITLVKKTLKLNLHLGIIDECIGFMNKHLGEGKNVKFCKNDNGDAK